MKSIRLLAAAVIVCMLLVGTAAAGEIITNGAMTSNLNGWGKAVDKHCTNSIARVYATAGGAYFETYTNLHGSAEYAYVELNQTIDVTGVNTVSVPYDVDAKYGEGTNYFNARVGSGTTHTRSTTGSGTFSIDVSGMSGNQVLKMWVDSRGASTTGMDVYVTGVTGTHTRTAPIVNSISADRTTGVAPLTVSFSANVTAGNPDIKNYDWNFFKGTFLLGSSTSATPSYTFDSGTGNYSATLVVDNTYYSSALVRQYIEVLDSISADFSANVTSGPSPLAVKFTDSSTGSPTAWYWTFGDGSNSTLQNPEHTYASSGSFSVSLNASNIDGYDIETKAAYITASYTPPYTGQAVGGLVTGENLQPLQAVEIILTNVGTSTFSTTQTNATGYYLFDNISAATYTVTAKKTGYLDIYTSPFILGAGEYKDQPFQMTPFGSTATGGIGSQYPPHIVRFYLVDHKGNNLGSNITVTAIGTQSTVGAWDWLTALFGIPSGAPIDTDAMSGTTGEDGMISFAMVDIVKYTMTFTRSPDISTFTYANYFPNNQYRITLPTTTYTPPTQTASFYLGQSEHNTTHTNVTAYITTDAPSTSTFKIDLRDTDKALLVSQSVSMGGAFPLLYNHTFMVDTDPGVEYYVQVTATNIHGTWFDQTRTITIRGRIFDFGIDSVWYQWIALSLMFCIGAIFTGRNTKIGAVVLPLFGGFMWWIGWLSVSVLLVSVAMVLGVIYYMRESEGGR